MLQALGHQKLSNNICSVLKESFRKEELQQRAWIEQQEESPKKKPHHDQPLMLEQSRDKHRHSIEHKSKSNNVGLSLSVKPHDEGSTSSNNSTYGSHKKRPISPLKSTCSSKHSTSHHSSVSSSASSKASIVSNASSSSSSSNNMTKSNFWFSNISDLVDSTDIGWGIRSERNVSSEDKDFFLDLQPLTSTKFSKKKVIETEFYDHSHFDGFLTHRRAPTENKESTIVSQSQKKQSSHSKKKKNLIFD
ncbi:hypothetical protein C9374_009859 [Naegleria lovaniensis]|uniref:Uncharacterized protein n=1 Tax=Naegleria lovaniensis TaxID=51637 RepID=A0AA88GET6_NAELO|nr:uncharacterized protein C9374_009859 [Naegleria lovaniensis]KAG2375236.1 hypothetical protein C9374_009859 [Naegleria lovaniensis]